MSPLVTWSARKQLSPLLTLAIGAAVGLVIGFILGGTCG